MLSKDEERILREAEEIRFREEAERMEAGEDVRRKRPEARDSRRSDYYYSSKNGSHSPEKEVFVENVYEEEQDWEEDDFSDEFEEDKPRKKHGFLRFLLALLIVLAGLLCGFVYYFSGKPQVKPLGEITEDPAWGLPEAGMNGVTNVLLIGTDARAEGSEDSRSDTMLICSICPGQKKVHLTSLLRDSYVTIPGVGMNRINMAYQLGGAELLIETIEQNFNIRIDHYFKVDFWSFAGVVDDVSGVEITVTDEEAQYVNAYLSEINQLMGIDAQDSFIQGGGTYHFNGRQALAYARIRYIGTDFGRTERQRTVIEALVNKVKSHPLNLLKAGNVLSELTTDMGRMELTKFILKNMFYAGSDIETHHIPFDGTWWNDSMGAGGEVLGMDIGQNARMLREIIYP